MTYTKCGSQKYIHCISTHWQDGEKALLGYLF